MAKVFAKDVGDTQYRGFRCPGCVCTHTLPITGPLAWRYNGDDNSPTFTPSVLWREYDEPGHAVRICHSFVTDGRIAFLPDSTHALKGQTVELPEVKTDG